uniref:Uncharacterized protein n=1 Tax=Anopheles maculatus TaxID=74869 RepID=A0A182T582_9DIPT
NEGRLTETEALEELKLLYTQLQRLYERIPQRGAAILTVASLMEACRTTSLRPPPAIGAPSPLKAIQSAGLTGASDGLSMASGATGASATTPSAILRLDKSTNTNTTATIPNGSVMTAPGNGSIGPMPPQTRITITDELDSAQEVERERHKQEARSIDGSDFRLDHQQLQCMCSGAADEEPYAGRDGLSRSMELEGVGGRNNNCCCSCSCCSSTRTRTGNRPQQHRRNDSVINNSTSAVQLTSAGGAVNCNCKISGVNDKSGSGSVSAVTGRRKPTDADGVVVVGGALHKAKQHTSELVLNCQFVVGGSEGGGTGGGGLGYVAPNTASSTLTPTTDEATIRSVNLEKFNKLYANNSSRIDSLKEHFLMRNALTTALQNLEIENRSRSAVNHERIRPPRQSSDDDAKRPESTGGTTEPHDAPTVNRARLAEPAAVGNPGADEAIN